MNALGLAAGLALAAFTLPAAAAPWQNTAREAGGYQIHYALQVDDTGQYTFALSCIEETGEYSMFVNTPVNWDATASYAPEVPTTITVNGTAYSDLNFRFLNGGGREVIAFDASGWAAEFATMQVALSYASGSIEFSYFDKHLVFAADGLDTALATLANDCSL